MPSPHEPGADSTGAAGASGALQPPADAVVITFEDVRDRIWRFSTSLGGELTIDEDVLAPAVKGGAPVHGPAFWLRYGDGWVTLPRAIFETTRP